MVQISGYPFNNGSAKALPLFRQKALFLTGQPLLA
jgi:hypothetical protein